MDPVRYVSALLLVGGLLAAAIWLLKRMRLAPRAGRSVSLDIVSHVSLGSREKLVVVRFGGKDLLLGVSAGGISRLAATRSAATSDGHYQSLPKRTP